MRRATSELRSTGGKVPRMSDPTAGEERGEQRQERANWCVNCWARSAGSCSQQQHCLLDAKTALSMANEELADITNDIQKLEVQQQLKRQRVDAVLDVVDEDGGVILEVDVDGGVYHNRAIDGGCVQIKVAVGEMSRDESENLCSGMEDLSMEHEVGEIGPTFPPASFSARVPASLRKRLPAQPNGQTVKEGTVLLSDKGEFKIYMCDTKVAVESGTKLFGKVTDNLNGIMLDASPSFVFDDIGGGTISSARVIQ